MSGSNIKIFIADLSMVNNAEDNKNLLSRNGEYSGSVKLTYVSCSFFNYLFRVHYENSINAVDNGCTYSVFCVAFCIVYMLHIL